MLNSLLNEIIDRYFKSKIIEIDENVLDHFLKNVTDEMTQYKTIEEMLIKLENVLLLNYSGDFVESEIYVNLKRVTNWSKCFNRLSRVNKLLIIKEILLCPFDDFDSTHVIPMIMISNSFVQSGKTVSL